MPASPSNPSIFEKAIGETECLRRRDRTPRRQRRDFGQRDLRTAGHRRHRRRRRHAASALRARPRGGTASSAWKYRPISPWTPPARSRKRGGCGRPSGARIFSSRCRQRKPGIPAIRQLLAEGLNINITLLFSQDVYEEVVEAFFSGLEDRARRGSTDRPHRQRRELLRQPHRYRRRQASGRGRRAHGERNGARELCRLRGKVAIANAKLAYRRWQRRFAGPRWERLKKLGARPQHCCGPAPERKIPPTAMCSISTS